MEVNIAPALSVNARCQVLAVEFSPYEWSRKLLAIALPTSVAVYAIKFKEEVEDGKEECGQVWEWQVSSQPVCLAWSPAATLRASPKCLQLTLASADHKVTQLSSDLGNSHTVQDLLSHTDFVNSVTYNGENVPFLVASVGDDLTARVWDTSTHSQVAKFLLTSPGMLARFHPEDPDLLLVAEKVGILRVYSVAAGCSTLSLRCPGPLLSADWSIPNPSLLVAAGARGLTVWNLASQQPRSEHVEVGGGEKVLGVSVCRSVEGLVATHAAPHTVRVTHLHSNKVPIAAHLKVVGGMSWHHTLPYLAVGSDRRILFWKIDNV